MALARKPARSRNAVQNFTSPGHFSQIAVDFARPHSTIR